MAGTPLNHQCVICDKLYHYCNTCGRAKNITPWKVVACSPECYAVYMAFVEYREGRMDKGTMKEILEKNGFKGRAVKPVLQPIFDELLKEDEVEEKVEEPVVAEEPSPVSTKNGIRKRWRKSQD